MPNIKSAIKRVEVSERNRKRNVAIKSAVKTAAKKVEATKSAEALKDAIKAIDMAVSKGVLHKNTAARKKSRLAKKVSAK